MNVPLSPGRPAQPIATAHAHGKIADIEVLRGIAILFVIESHVHGNLLTWPMPLWAHIHDAYVAFWDGVDLFFVISGFVIARTLLPRLQLAKSRTAFAAAALSFWLRRVWRLLPSAWLWLAIILAASAVFNRSGAFGRFHDNYEAVIAALLSVANIHFAGAMDGAFREGASAPYWSLALEEQFYLALPLLVFAAGRHLTAVLLALTALMFVLPEDTMYFGVLRIQPILLGVLLAVLARDPIYRLMQPSWLGRSRLARRFCLAMLLFWLASLAPLRQTILPYRFDAIAVISVLLVFIASYDQGYICAEGSLKRVLVWFGSRSYALYLVHVPVFCATRELFTRLNPPDIVFDHRFLAGFLLVGLGATLVLAELNYRCVEQPLRRRGKRAGLTFEQKHAVLFQKNRPPDSGASCA